MTEYKLRNGKPLLMIDMALTRDIDPNLEGTDNIFLYNIDDLQDIIDTNLQERTEAAEKILTMIEGELNEFKHWVNLLEVVPVITALNKKASMIQTSTLESIKRKLPNLTDHEIKIIDKHTKSIVNQFFKDPLIKLKEIANSFHLEKELDVFIKVFNLANSLKENNQSER
ncbi:hypothetical protein GNT69_20310 [Bacillus sp. B15-48]|nr:hypothetical protein [Bacillus sp. B15-48]